MLYTITKKMTKKEIKIFENIIGEKIKRIFVRGMPKQLTIVDGMDLFEVILEMENEKIKICCRSSVEIDGDEYVQFEVKKDEKKKDEFNYISITIEEEINRILIFSDDVSWENEMDQWNIHSDVEILLETNKKKFLFEAIDSIAGFIEIYQNEANIRNRINDTESIWTAFKTDKICKVKRSCIELK